MDLHRSSTRRGFFRTAVGTSVAAVAWSAYESAGSGAKPPTASVTASAAASSPARRVGRPGGPLLLPVDPSGGGLVCLNNFLGRSSANGSCGHRGVDVGELVDNTPGRPLVACVDGVVERDGTLGSAGRFRILRGDDGRWYRYHHLDEYAEDVAEGDRVAAGTVIGTMGRSGNTDWTHLHFEVWEVSAIPRDGTVVDPVPLITFPADVQVDEPRRCDTV